MKYLLLLTLIGCANNQYKRHSYASVKYTVREYYYPSKTAPVEVAPRALTKKKNKVKIASKISRSKKKLDCGEVFAMVNQCMSK